MLLTILTGQYVVIFDVTVITTRTHSPQSYSIHSMLIS